MKKINEIVRDIRVANKLSQKELAAKLVIAQQTFSNYESGKVEFPLHVILGIAELFDVSTDFLLGRSRIRYRIEDTNLNKPFCPEVSVGDFMRKAQRLNKLDRQKANDYIEFLLFQAEK